LNVGIRRIAIRGFRGVNRPIEIELVDSLVVQGLTGSGKTTILHAIEWALYGKISGFKGPGFTEEDAYVNIFSDKPEASVEIELCFTTGENLVISRSRKMASKSTISKTTLELHVNGFSYSGKEAQEQIVMLIGLNHERFLQSVFLHQDTIRQIVEGKPGDRDTVIDQLLGTGSLREFAEALDPKRLIPNEIKVLRTVKDRQEGEEARFEIQSRMDLEEQKNKLIAQGYKERNLTLPYLDGQLEQISKKLSRLADSYGQSTQVSDRTSSNVVDVKTSFFKTNELLRNLDRMRLKLLAERKEETARLEAKLDLYKNTRKELSIVSDTTSADFDRQVLKLKSAQEKARSDFKQLQNDVEELENLVDEYRRQNDLIKKKEILVEDFMVDHGNTTAIIAKLNRTENRLMECKNEYEQGSSLVQLLVASEEYIRDKIPSQCPVCAQGIEPQDILNRLEIQNQETGQHIQEVRREIIRLEKTAEKLANDRAKIESMQSELDSLSIAKNDSFADICRIIDNANATIEDADSIIQERRGSVEECSCLLKEIDDELRQLENNRKSEELLRTRFRSAETDLQKLLSSEVSEDKLISASNEVISSINETIELLEENQTIDSLQNELDDLANVLDYIQAVEEYESRFDRGSSFREHLDIIDTQIADLEEFESSLQRLRDIVSETQGELASQALDKFQSSIDRFYRALIGHPYFQHIRIQALPTDPVTYDIKFTNDHGTIETNINTRFSTAQMNATALAIFLAVNQSITCTLPIIILDDPTQNMDRPHSEAMAQILSKLSKNRQIVLATHEKGFVQSLTENMGGNVRMIEMRTWTTDGVKMA